MNAHLPATLATSFGVRGRLFTLARRLLGVIDKRRAMAKPGDSPFWIIDAGRSYAQALAPAEPNIVRLEVRLAAIERAERLTDLGFAPPAGKSPNPALDAGITRPSDLDALAAVAALVLAREAALAGGVTATLHLPDEASRQTFVRF